MAAGDDVVGALAEHAYPLASVEPGADLDDLALLAEALSGAAVVGLGEVTHGTRECFQVKHRVVRLLVEERSFRTLALEAPVASAVALDEYVRSGSGDATTALSELDRWLFATEGFRALLDWIRAFNEGRERADQVRIRGMDVDTPAAPAEVVVSYLRAVDQEYGMVADDDLTQLAEGDVPRDDADARERWLAGAQSWVETVTERLDAHRDRYVQASSAEAWAFAWHCCRVVDRTCAWNRIRFETTGPSPEGMAERDRVLAEHVRWCLDYDPGEGVVVWAHNSHVQRGTFDDGTAWTDEAAMGEHLAREYGDSYRALGFDFGRGGFRAIDAERGELRSFEVGDPLKESATARFDAVATGPTFVDLDGIDKDSPAAEWLASERRSRWVGSVFDPAGDRERHYLETDLLASFDGLVYLPETNPAVALGET